jgi:hypothetical protein
VNQHHSNAKIKTLLRQDLGTFIARVLKEVSPADRYLHSWHVDAIAYYLSRIHDGDLRRLTINQPPQIA